MPAKFDEAATKPVSQRRRLSSDLRIAPATIAPQTAPSKAVTAESVMLLRNECQYSGSVIAW